MKKYWIVWMIACVGMMMVSCKNNASYTDMLKAERRAIDRLIDEKGFEILKKFPKDSVFTDKQFVILESGVYLQIVDKGTGKKPVLGSTEILCRFSADRFSLDPDEVPAFYKSPSNYGPHSNGTYPLLYIYGHVTLSAGNNEAYTHYLMSEGLAEGLNYVTQNGKVRLIVPFKRGAENDANSGYPVYFEIVQYKFD